MGTTKIYYLILVPILSNAGSRDTYYLISNICSCVSSCLLYIRFYLIIVQVLSFSFCLFVVQVLIDRYYLISVPFISIILYLQRVAILDNSCYLHRYSFLAITYYLFRSYWSVGLRILRIFLSTSNFHSNVS